MGTWEKEYPRPQMVRDNYQIIHKGWTLNGGHIQVPFPPESKASEYQGRCGELLRYEVEFEIEREPEEERILLHFGAVDQIAEIYVNNIFVGEHKGGYLPFFFDITEVIKLGKNQLRVEATDTLDRKYPYGKQSKKPRGMWYTQISGIWQSVWFEYVPVDGVFDIRIQTTMQSLQLGLICESPNIRITIKEDNDGEILYQEVISGVDFFLDFEEKKLPVHLWSPDNPYLYGLTIETEHDKVESYFALREISIDNKSGRKRLYLNESPLFLQGVLDQGYFQDGIFLPSDPMEYDRDVKRMKALGMNTLRKHIKVEPERFYYACDRYGMLVMQDMVNSGGYNFIFDTVFPTLGMWHRRDRWPWGKKRKEIFEQHSIGIIRTVRNHPCVVAYTIFNEGWGQFEADRMYDVLKAEDPDKVFDATSGWFVQKKSDLGSYHIYFRNERLHAKERPLLLSECGGYTRSIKGHLYNPNVRYGYGRTETEEELTKQLRTMYDEMVIPSIKDGLCGCIYTQLSDVETEINGFYTYDRQVCKVNQNALRRMSLDVYKARAEEG